MSSMSNRPMDPLSGNYTHSASGELVKIPSWEKGRKKVNGWDSSDLSGISSGSGCSSGSEYDCDSSFDTSASPPSKSILADLDKTPRAAAKTHRLNKRTSSVDIKGKGQAVASDSEADNEESSSLARSPAKGQAQDHGHPHPLAGGSAKSRPRRPRSHSNATTASVASDSPTLLSSAAAASTSPAASPATISDTRTRGSTDQAETQDDQPRFATFSRRAPGPAAQAMADFMSGPSKVSIAPPTPSTSRQTSSSSATSASQGNPTLLPASSLALSPSGASSSSLASNGRQASTRNGSSPSQPSSFARRPLSRPAHLQQQSSRQLGRATSAPNNLFGESMPTNNLFSPGRVTLPRTDEEDDFDTCPPSPEADQQAVIDRAYEARSGNIDLSNKNLVRITPAIGELSHFVSLDMRTGSSHPTPIYIDLSNNFLNSAGLPSSLFHIPNLTMLSLRSNYVESLPQSIGNLTGLKQLLLFNNKLTYLPAEILELRLDALKLGSNRFPTYQHPGSEKKVEKQEGKDDEKTASQSEAGQHGLDTSVKRVCELRNVAFKVPTLGELCTRRLLEPVGGDRLAKSLNSSPAITRAKLFTPGLTNASGSSTVRRHFHAFKDQILSPRTDMAPLPPHLLKPFLPLLHPLPHHLRNLMSPSPSPSLSAPNTPAVNPSPYALSRSVSGSASERSTTFGTPSSPHPAQSNYHATQAFEATKDIPQCSVCKTSCSQFAETRIEWRNEIAGFELGKSTDERCWIPVLWRGCSSHCLDFLEES